jgi:hypothetical protein
VGSSQDFTNSSIVKISWAKHERNQEAKLKSFERPKTAIERNVKIESNLRAPYILSNAVI